MTDLPAALPEPPRLVPWTFETRPEGCVWVCAKGIKKDEWLITRWMIGGVSMSSQIRTYHELLDGYTQRDGSPCGREETP